MDINLIIVTLYSYFLGSIPFGFILIKIFLKQDIRETGSGNIGATNVLRTGNKSAAFLTLIMDIAKGSIVVFLAREFLGITASHFAAFGVFIGHLFSIFLFFKGGKGVATFIGIQIILNIYIGIFVCIVWVFIALTTRFSSLSSLISSIFSLLILVIINDLSYVWVQTIMVLLIIISHRKNIYNLISGKESKIKLIKY